MLVIAIPNGETKGQCRINGEPCEFEIEDDAFSFRPAGSPDPWDRRAILSADRGPELTSYACASADGSGGTVISPRTVLGGASPPTEEATMNADERWRFNRLSDMLRKPDGTIAPTPEAFLRTEREHPDSPDAEKYRLSQAATLMAIFEVATGMPPKTMGELEEAVSVADGRQPDPDALRN